MNLFSRLLFIILCALFFWHASGNSEEDDAREYLKSLSGIVCQRYHEDRVFEWNYASNVSEDNLNKMIEHGQTILYAPEQNFSWNTFKDPDLPRQAWKYGLLTPSTQDELDQLDKLNVRYVELINNMADKLNNLEICNYRNRSDCTLSLDGEIADYMATSSDPDELLYYWTETTHTIGKAVRSMYEECIQLSNHIAVLGHFKNMGEKWIADSYEMGLSEFEQQMDDLWEELQPLYLQLHAYVRNKLHEYYGDCVLDRTGPIPAHLLGNVWASHWESLYKLTVPYPNKPSIDDTPEIEKQNFTMKKIMELAEDFYTSMNMSAMTKSFWKNSILEQPEDRVVNCAGTAFDFYNGEDYRILYCGTGTMEDLRTIYHETGHIEYFMAYSNQPCCYRNGANQAFHEAVGNTIGLSVSSVKHLQRLGVLKKGIEKDKELQINALYRNAIEEVAFLQYGLTVEKWRWALFRGDIGLDKMNTAWCYLRYDIGGISPPVPPSEKNLDAATKIHILDNEQYIDYYIGTFLEYQFHEALCKAAGQYDPKDPGNNILSNCDIYGSVSAGNLLKSMLQLGASKPWPVSLETITGQRKMVAKPLLDYYQPLYEWLVKENKRTGEKIGWDMRCL